MRFHVLSDDLDEADKAALKGIASRREGTQVCFYSPARALSKKALKSINESLIANRTHVTAATFYRLLAADLLPPDAHKVLYVDGDALCTDSLDGLFNIDLKGSPVGMCIEPSASKIDTYNRLGYPPKEGYFIFDLDLWRKEKLTQHLLDYLSLNAKKILWHDQDVINAVLHGRIFQLDFSANVLPSYFYIFYWLQEEKNGYYARKTQFLLKEEWAKLKAAVEHPLAAHFHGVIKPWYRECEAPFAHLWRYFYAQSPWKNEPLKRYNARLPAKLKIKWHGRRALERLNLVAPANPPCPQEAYKAAQEALDRLLALGRGK